nr:unknown [Glycine max]
MKRTMPWSDDDESSSSHSDSERDSETGGENSKGKSRKQKTEKSGVIDFEALKRHGYRGGPSVLKVPAPKEDDSKQDWSWSTGKEKRVDKEIEESYEERKKTREAISLGEELPAALTRNDKKNISFSQKEKRKRELGQASRGKNYVEEEKRLLRENGIYSGF